MKKHPFEWLTIKAQKRAFVVLLLITLAVMGGLQFLDAPLKTDAAPAGIVSFEFAGSLSSCQTYTRIMGTSRNRLCRIEPGS